MAVELLEGFDWTNQNNDIVATGLANKFTSLSGGGLTGTSRTGVSGWQLGYNNWLERILSGNKATLAVGCALKIQNAAYTPACGLFVFYDNTTVQATIGLDTSGKLAVYRGSESGTLLGTGTTVINNSGFYSIQAKVVFHGSTGAVTVKVNNVAEITLTGQNTIATANAYATKVRFFNTQGSTGVYWIDDCYIDDADFLGDLKIVSKVPDGAGTHTDFTPSAGANWQNVDDGASYDSDSTYNASSTNGHIDSYAITALGLTGNIVGVNQIAFLRKDDAGARLAALFLKSGATDSVGSDINLSSGYAAYSRLLAQDPNGPIGWTVTNLNASEPGVKVTS